MKALSIVIPIYNEEAILDREVTRLIREMKHTFPDMDWEVFLVENGSYDRTKAIVEDLKRRFPEVRAFHLPVAGYGPALKRGLLESNATHTALFNIDFWDVPFLVRAFAIMKERGVDMVVGSKTAPGAEDTRPFVRRLITQTFNWLLKKAFGFRGTDTHGMKLLKTERIIPVVESCKTEREIFDTEFVLRSELAGLKSEEIPVVCQERRKTTYRISKRIPRTAKDLLVLFFSLRYPQLNKKLAGIVLASLLFFTTVAFYGFPDSPTPWFDMGVNLGIAKTFVEDGVFSLRLAPGHFVDNRPLMISTNYPLLDWIILSFTVFGVGLWQAQIVMILFLAAYLMLAFQLLRRWYGGQAAVLALPLLVTFVPFFGHGMSGGLGEVPGLVYLLAALLLFDTKSEGANQSPWRLFFAGLFFGLCAATKVFYLTVLGAIAAAELWRAGIRHEWPWRRWLALGLGIAGPLIAWVFSLLPDGFSRASVEKALEYYRNPYALEGVMSDNLWRFVSESTPVHFALLAITVFVFFALRAKRKMLRAGEVVLAVLILINTVYYVKSTPGWYRYFFPAHLLLLTFFSAALEWVTPLFPWQKFRKYFAPVVVAVLVAVQGLYLIQVRDDRFYHNPAPRAFAAIVDEVARDTDLAIINHPEFWFLLKHPTATQYIEMNPYVAFGSDVLASIEQLPTYLITSELYAGPYLKEHKDLIEREYGRERVVDAYILWKKK